MRAHGDQHRVKALPAQLGDGEVAAGGGVQLQGDVAGLEDLAHLRFHHAARQAILGNAEVQHAPGDRGGLEDGDRVPHQGQVVRRREPHRSAADHGDLEWQLLDPFRAGRQRVLGFRPVALGKEPLQRAYGDGLVDLAAPARGLARVRADAAADAGHGVGIAGIPVRLLEASFGDQADVTPGIGVRRARHHAGKIRVQPVAIDFFVDVPVLHRGPCAPG